MKAASTVFCLALFCSCGPSHTVFEDVVYDQRFGTGKMDVWVPSDASGSGPAVFIVHGGGWDSGDKGDVRITQERFTDFGFVTASIDYRLIPAGTFPASSQDVSCAWDFFISQADVYGFDPQRVALMGYSSGGQLVSLHATAQSLESIKSDCGVERTTMRPAAVISSSGQQRLLEYAEEEGLASYVGGTQKDARQLWIDASPITYVDSDDPPFLFVHGEGDILVPIVHAQKMRRALDEVGVKTRLLEIPGGGHLLNPGPGGGELETGAPDWSPEAFIVMEDFLYDTVGRP